MSAVVEAIAPILDADPLRQRRVASLRRGPHTGYDQSRIRQVLPPAGSAPASAPADCEARMHNEQGNLRYFEQDRPHGDELQRLAATPSARDSLTSTDAWRKQNVHSVMMQHATTPVQSDCRVHGALPRNRIRTAGRAKAVPRSVRRHVRQRPPSTCRAMVGDPDARFAPARGDRPLLAGCTHFGRGTYAADRRLDRRQRQERITTASRARRGL